MDDYFDILSYYKRCLTKVSSESSTFSISQCVLKGWFHGFGKRFGIDNMRLYLYDDRSNKMLVYPIFGCEELWEGVFINSFSEFSRKKAKEKKLFMERKLHFVEIRSIRENGQALKLGYVAFHTENDVTESLLLSLDVLCILYGNYIVKRLMSSHYVRMNNILPKIYNEAASVELPGTKIRRLLFSLHRISAFNYGIYCTVYGNSIVTEYITNYRSKFRLLENVVWQVSPSFIEGLSKNSINRWYQLSEFPDAISGFILNFDDRRPSDFTVQLYPIYIDHELVGLWMFVFSKHNLFKDFSATSIRILEGSSSLLNNSYRFLFQRRFKAMIVNPIFQNRDTRINPDSVFIIMPFSEKWSNEIWEQVLRPAVQEMGMTPVRADDLYGQNIMEDVWQGILKASIIICDTTGRNPNVFYELGIAHALGKKVLLLAQNMDDIPFDLRALRHIKYQVSISGGNQLKEKIKVFIKETLSNNT